MRPATILNHGDVQTSESGSSVLPSQSTGMHSDPWELQIVQRLVDRLGVNEIRRRFTHMTPVFLPFLLWPFRHDECWDLSLLLVVLGSSIGGVGVLLFRFREIARRNEANGIGAVVGYAVPILTALALMPHRAEVGLMTLAIVAIGDGSATMGGICLGGWKLPWNQQKTFAGLLCFCFFGTLFSTIIYWGEAFPQVSWTAAITCAGISTAAAAFMESLPLDRWNDNFRVGATAAIVGTLVQNFIVGY